jgi:exonuclease SbcD
MPDPIRVLHFADLHVGMENYGRIDPLTGTSSRVRDFLDRLDELIDYALANEADLVVFAGDAFKSRDPNPTQQREFAQRIKRLADVTPTLLLVGNHDMPGMPSKASSVDIFHALDVPGVMVGRRPEGRVVETRRGKVYLAWLPYPMRNRLLSSQEHQGKSIEELEVALRQTVADILRDLAEGAAEHDMPRVLVSHLTVAEAMHGSERTVMLGGDVAVQISNLANPALERIDFGEEKEAKGFCWVQLARNKTTWEFVPVAARPFHTLHVDVRDRKDPMQTVLAEAEKASVADAVVRVMIQLHSDQQPALREREIENALSEAASVSIVREIEIEARARLGDVTPERMTPLELVEKYFQSRDESPERIKALLAKAEELLRDTS